MTAFISRALSADSAFRRLLVARDWQVTGCSLVELSPLPFHTLPVTDWIFFSSQHAVRFFFQQIEQAGIELLAIQWAALGEATAKVLEGYIGAVDFSGSGDPAAAAAAFREVATGSSVLFPGARHSQQSVQRLLKAAVQGIHLEVYDNRPVAHPAQRNETVLVFTSPLNAEAYFAHYRLQTGQQVVAIGATTAATLRSIGLPSISTASAPTEAALAAAVLEITTT